MKDKPFQFGEVEMNCFLSLKEKLIESPVLLSHHYIITKTIQN